MMAENNMLRFYFLYLCAHVEAADSHLFVFFCVSQGPYEMICLPILVFGLGIVKLFIPEDRKANGYH